MSARTITIAIFTAAWLVACGDGPGIIDRPDYAGFLDNGHAIDAKSDTADATDRDSSGPDTGPDDIFPDTAGDTVYDETFFGDAELRLPDSYVADTAGGDVPPDDAATDDGGDDTADPDIWLDMFVPDAADAAVDEGFDYETGEYTGIYTGLDDTTGVALVQALCPLVRTGTTTVSYDNAKDYLRADIDAYDGKIQEIYTGQWWDPDAGVINVEHTWPQSKGAGSAPAQGDMHHLYLAHKGYNSARSNYPYGNVVNISYDGNDVAPFPDENCTDGFPESDWTGCMTYVGNDSLGGKVCEPRDAHKGNVARAVFYFQLRYGGSGCSLKPLSDFDTYGAAHVALTEETLREWNRRDPPDDHERDRNGRIAVREGVRNPFIDHPEFVERIDFTP